MYAVGFDVCMREAGGVGFVIQCGSGAGGVGERGKEEAEDAGEEMGSEMSRKEAWPGVLLRRRQGCGYSGGC